MTQLEGYVAFEPRPLPPQPPLDLDLGMVNVLSDATLQLGRLDGIAARVPNPDLFVAMYVRQEAVLSSQIEGTQASLTDVLQFEAGNGGGRAAQGRGRGLELRAGDERRAAPAHDAAPVEASGARDSRRSARRHPRRDAHPGRLSHDPELDRPPGSTLGSARFVPPPPRILHDVLDAWERFLHDEAFPPLVQAALAHAQFETIHPFLDGNGRIGRLLITFLLCTRGVLKRPLLYLSAFLKRNRAEYYDRLQAVREHGHWEAWVRFFLRGVAEVARDATATADRILDLQRELQQKVMGDNRSANLLKTLDHLYLHPAITVAQLQTALGVSSPTANSLVARCVELEILQEITGQRRNRWFHFDPFLNLFESAAPLHVSEAPADETHSQG